MKVFYYPSVRFNQSEMMDFLYTDCATSLINKIASVSLSKECYSGFCHGLARLYIHNQEKSSDCMIDINSYIKTPSFIKNNTCKKNQRTKKSTVILDRELDLYLTKLQEKIRLKKGEKSIAAAIEIQTLHEKKHALFSLNNIDGFFSEVVPASKFLDKLKSVSDLNKETHLEVTMVNDFEVYNNEDYFYSEINSYNKNSLEKLYERVFFDKLDEESQNENFFNDTVLQLKTKVDVKKTHFKSDEISDFLQAHKDIESKKISSEISFLDSKYGVKGGSKYKIMLSDFLFWLGHKTERNSSYLISSKNHTMALNTDFTEKKEDVSFFDPNEGIYTFNHLNEFSDFLLDFIETHPEYKFSETETDYTFNIEKYSRTTTKQDYSSDFRNHLTKEWRKKQISLKVKEGDNSVITPVSFNTSTGLLEMAYHNNQISGRIYTFQPDIKVIHAFLKDNIELLQQNEAVYFIDIMSEAYQIEDEKLISQLNYHSNPKALFGSPIPLW